MLRFIRKGLETMIDFQNFDITDNERYKKYLSLCIQIPSNLSPFFVVSSRDEFKFRRGYADNLCWHEFIWDGVKYWAPPAGDWDEINWHNVFAAHVPARTIFYSVPEYLVNLWQRELGLSIEVEENRDEWDYILHLDRMEKLSGSKLETFRQERDAFEKNYDYTVEEITPEIFDEMREFQTATEENLQQRVEKLEIAKSKNEQFYFALEHWDELKNLFGFVVRVDGKIVAYSIDEQIDEAHSVGLFAKANYDFKGINQFNFWYDAKINLERGILTENIMDDVGEEHLRFFKEHLNPLVMLKKFTVVYTPAKNVHDVKISSVRDGENLTLKLSGKLNTDSANFAKNEILSALDGVKKLTFDLNGLEYISSSGLRILIAAMKKIRAQGGKMTVKNVGEQVREVLEMTGFAEIFNLGWRPNI